MVSARECAFAYLVTFDSITVTPGRSTADALLTETDRVRPTMGMNRVGYRMLGTESIEPNIFKYRVPITKFTRFGTGIEKILLQLHGSTCYISTLFAYTQKKKGSSMVL